MFYDLQVEVKRKTQFAQSIKSKPKVFDDTCKCIIFEASKSMARDNFA